MASGLKAQSSSIVNYELPWVEKYRPIVLDDIVGNSETIERLKIIAKDGNMPHVIISGMPGIGKTTSILCLARQLLGDCYKEAVLELNASDERGRQQLPLVSRCLQTNALSRNRCCAQSYQSFCSEEGDAPSRPSKIDHP